MRAQIRHAHHHSQNHSTHISSSIKGIQNIRGSRNQELILNKIVGSLLRALATTESCALTRDRWISSPRTSPTPTLAPVDVGSSPVPNLLAIAGAGACLNSAGSAWLLAMPALYHSHDGVRHAVAEAVGEFQRREAHAEDDARPATPYSAANSCDDDDATDGEETSPAAEDAAFDLDVFNDVNWDLYYASLAQGMLVEPPCAVSAFGDDGEAHVADASLWSY